MQRAVWCRSLLYVRRLQGTRSLRPTLCRLLVFYSHAKVYLGRGGTNVRRRCSHPTPPPLPPLRHTRLNAKRGDPDHPSPNSSRTLGARARDGRRLRASIRWARPWPITMLLLRSSQGRDPHYIVIARASAFVFSLASSASVSAPASDSGSFPRSALGAPTRSRDGAASLCVRPLETSLLCSRAPHPPSLPPSPSRFYLSGRQLSRFDGLANRVCTVCAVLHARYAVGSGPCLHPRTVP
ncbi:hypothetical protein C8Q77DRAFT_485727 [Trametes polyzona]|nr:hypothetical protein C8Q77DRAFT_485727 [Trametes polyzona]